MDIFCWIDWDKCNEWIYYIDLVNICGLRAEIFIL